MKPETILKFLERNGFISGGNGIADDEVIAITVYTIENMQAVLFYIRECGYDLDHETTRAGYISRRISGTIQVYKGRNGNGFLISKPSYNGTKYYPIFYYLCDSPQTAENK